MKVDATIPRPQDPGEGPENLRGWPPLIKMDEAVKVKVESILKGKV